mmetsp:Transcript_21726/g.52209  ORF Transcript_21726/g.52209 Transcript_21726/m.52209 type:complete len:248 (-) Transcript_21726:267-1010(-)
MPSRDFAGSNDFLTAKSTLEASCPASTSTSTNPTGSSDGRRLPGSICARPTRELLRCREGDASSSMFCAAAEEGPWPMRPFAMSTAALRLDFRRSFDVGTSCLTSPNAAPLWYMLRVCSCCRRWWRRTKRDTCVSLPLCPMTIVPLSSDTVDTIDPPSAGSRIRSRRSRVARPIKSLFLKRSQSKRLTTTAHAPALRIDSCTWRSWTNTTNVSLNTGSYSFLTTRVLCATFLGFRFSREYSLNTTSQ